MRTKSKLCIVALLFCMQLISCKKDECLNPEDPTPVDTVTAKENLVAWYKFTNRNTADFSGNNNHLLAYNAVPATDYKGRSNNAYSFNGFSSFMQAISSNSLNPSKITLAALFKPEGYYTGLEATSRIFMKGASDQSNGVYFLGFNNNGSCYGTYGNNQYQSNGMLSPENTIQLGNWYKLVYTYDGNIGKLYINGTLVNQQSKVASFTPNDDLLRIGVTGREDYPYWFNGVIDEIRIYNIDLAPAQVTSATDELGTE